MGECIEFSAVVLLCALSARFSLHPMALLLSVVAYSNPAVLFGGIIFWWLGRVEPKVSAQKLV